MGLKNGTKWSQSKYAKYFLKNLTYIVAIVDWKDGSTQHPWQGIDQKEAHEWEVLQCSTRFLEEEPPEIRGSYVGCTEAEENEEDLPELIHDIVEPLDDAKQLKDHNCQEEYQVIKQECADPIWCNLQNERNKISFQVGEIEKKRK